VLQQVQQTMQQQQQQQQPPALVSDGADEAANIAAATSVAAASSVGPKPKHALRPEVLQRIEQNRLAALRRRQERARLDGKSVSGAVGGKRVHSVMASASAAAPPAAAAPAAPAAAPPPAAAAATTTATTTANAQRQRWGVGGNDVRKLKQRPRW
jgi:hypothetical protein